ncbi:MAG TPA: hypothetical protein VFU00_10315, partial [Gemmatimonadales bacterium]|nr:hypothetical protein [Gemmatimonadales bacterium]
MGCAGLPDEAAQQALAVAALSDNGLKTVSRDSADFFEQLQQVSRFNGGSVGNAIVLGAPASRACSVALGNV